MLSEVRRVRESRRPDRVQKKLLRIWVLEGAKPLPAQGVGRYSTGVRPASQRAVDSGFSAPDSALPFVHAYVNVSRLCRFRLYVYVCLQSVFG